MGLGGRKVQRPDWLRETRWSVAGGSWDGSTCILEGRQRPPEAKLIVNRLQELTKPFDPKWHMTLRVGISGHSVCELRNTHRLLISFGKLLHKRQCGRTDVMLNTF